VYVRGWLSWVTDPAACVKHDQWRNVPIVMTFSVTLKKYLVDLGIEAICFHIDIQSWQILRETIGRLEATQAEPNVACSREGTVHPASMR